MAINRRPHPAPRQGLLEPVPASGGDGAGHRPGADRALGDGQV